MFLQHLLIKDFLLKQLCLSPVKFAGDVDVIHEALNVERQVGGVGAHQLLELLALLVESHQRPWLGLHVQLVLLPELLTEVADQDVVEVLPAKLRIECCSQDLMAEGEIHMFQLNNKK